MNNGIEVLSVQRYIDLSNGKPIYQVTMAEPHQVTDEIKSRLPDDQNSSTEIYSNMVQFTVPIDKGKLYPVGSTWKIEFSIDGTLNIKPLKKQ